MARRTEGREQQPQTEEMASASTLSAVNREPLINQVIFASAGTGKTFRLANRYIETLRVASPERILASTFTRKAAGEILERVLKHLAEAASSTEGAAKVATYLGLEGMTLGEARKLLRTLTRNLHRVRISTIDAFFMNAVTNLTLELGLPPGWRLMEETEEAALRLLAIERMLQQDPDESRRLLQLLNAGNTSRSVQSQLVNAVETYYSIFRHTSIEAWQHVPMACRSTDDEVSEAAEGLAALTMPKDKTWSNAHEKGILWTRNRNWTDLLAKGIASKVFMGESSFSRKPIPPPVILAYQRAIALARRDLIAVLLDKTAAIASLLQRFDVQSKLVRRETRTASFDDVVLTLVEGQREQRLGQLAYRMDTQFDHLLLDEFQDTSLSQWRAMQSLAESAAREQGCSFFCVGDAKQAIYSWRGGDANLFLSIPKQLGIESSPLLESYRSSPVIMDAVNQICENLDFHPALDDTVSGAIGKWKGRFIKHCAFYQELPGYVSLRTAPQADDARKEQFATTLRYAIEQIRELSERAPGAEIGVLVRRNNTVQQLVHGLREAGVPASNEGKGQLIDSVAVQGVLALLQMADHPGDTVARFHVAHSPIGALFQLDGDCDDEQARRVSRQVRRSLLVEGYGRFLDRLARKLIHLCSDHSRQRMQQLVDAGFAYSPKESMRPSEFVAYVQNAKFAAPTGTAVRVMTVHQSKGLEFDIVVLPELGSAVSGGTPSVVKRSSSPMEPPEIVIPYPSRELRGLLPEKLQQAVEETIAESVQEELCQLYVAMTRARSVLLMIVPPASKSEKDLPKTIAGLLRAAVAKGAGEPETLLWELGDPQWSLQPPDATESLRGSDHVSSASTGNAIGGRAVQLAQAKQTGPGGLPTVSPSQIGHRAPRRLASLFSQERSGALMQGTLIHAFFEHVIWIEDGVPSREELTELSQGFVSVNSETDGVMTEVDVAMIEQCIERFHRVAQQPNIYSTLSRGAYSEFHHFGFSSAVQQRLSSEPVKLEVYRERHIRVRDGQQIINGTIDRLVLLKQGERVVAADILDFKTDAMDSGGHQTSDPRWEAYREQLRLYARGVSLQYGLEAGGVSAQLVFLSAGNAERVRLED